MSTEKNEINEPVSFGRRVSLLASLHPERKAIVFAPKQGDERHISWAELDQSSNRLARLLEKRGVDQRSMVVVGIRNCPEHVAVTIGAWKLGACVLPLSPALPVRERFRIVELTHPTVIVADWDEFGAALVRADDLKRVEGFSDQPLPDRIPNPGKAIATGGSTGLPKVIVYPRPLVRSADGFIVTIGQWLGMKPGQVQLVAGPLYHDTPSGWSHWGLQEDHTLIVMERFDAARAIDLIERYRVNFGFLVPTMMHRIIQLPDIKQRDFSSVEAFFHTAAPCAAWLKQAWIDLIGGVRLYEGYGSAEGAGFTSIRGDEWLDHRGSVGQPRGTDLRILDDNGNELPSGEVGEIFTRLKNPTGPFSVSVGSPPPKSTADGFISVGDMGWVDDAGYLFLADRRTDLIISGGANIYPAEVESALTEHRAILDVAVVGVPDEDWGKYVHAIIQPLDPARPPTVAELDAHCRERLVGYKVPRSYEFVARLPRDDSGKIRRTALAAEREQGWTSGMIATTPIKKEVA